MKVESSSYLALVRPLLKKLLDGLLERYEYASVLATDVEMKSYSVNRSGIRITENNMFGRRGFTARVYKDGGYAEYSANCLKEEDIPSVLARLNQSFKETGNRYERFPTPPAEETPLSFSKSTEFLADPRKLGDEEIVKKLVSVREEGLKADEMLVDCTTRFNYQVYHKLFLSRSRDLEQNVMFSDCSAIFIGRKEEALKDGYSASSALGGAEILERLPDCSAQALDSLRAALAAEPIQPGEYECICTPQVTGMIVHEAFGHGVEMDMFVKDRALAKNCVGTQVASELVTMKDGAATSYEDVASYFFDDEGNPASDTVIIDRGILVSGICDGVSAARLGVRPTGNGRRESVDHKVYTRMTNTFFTEGTSRPEDMIASVKEGLLLDCPTSGMEDPKNWGIQCMVSFGREIRDGRLTGRVFGPIVLTGYVPDLLKSISMISDTVGHCGSGACGKGWKEWVKVSDGGPYIKARIRLG